MTTITRLEWDALPLDVRKRFINTDIELPDSVWDRVLKGAVSLSALMDNMLEVRADYATTQRAELLDIRAECLDELNGLIDGVSKVTQLLAEIGGDHSGRSTALALYDLAVEDSWSAQREMLKVIARVSALLADFDRTPIIANVDAVLALWSESGLTTNSQRPLLTYPVAIDDRHHDRR
jgi:hypothetical protein